MKLFHARRKREESNQDMFTTLTDGLSLLVPPPRSPSTPPLEPPGDFVCGLAADL